MTRSFLDFNEIGVWSELKLEIVQQYGSAYTTAFNNFPGLKKYYIGGFSGAGRHVSKKDRTVVEGSPARALNGRCNKMTHSSAKIGSSEKSLKILTGGGRGPVAPPVFKTGLAAD